MYEKYLEISLFGACIVRSTSGQTYEITGTKHKALFALLATAPFGRRTRSYLQNTLWGTSTFDSGRQSLRRALSDIKAIMGDDYECLITASHAEIALNLDKVKFIGRPGGGEFLEGLDIKDNEFNDWLRGMRLHPEQIFALYSSAHQAPAKRILPAVAVIPFRDVSTGGDHNKILGDWLAEEVCRSLSRSNLLAVISHLSARALAKDSILLAQIRKVLGVDYCVTGSLRDHGGRLTLDVDFLDTDAGQILWTRQFSGTHEEFLATDSMPVSELVVAVGGAIASNTLAHTRGRAVTSLGDHELLIAGVGLMHQLKLSSFARSRELIEEAIRRAPQAAEAHAWLAEWYVMSASNGWSTDLKRDASLALDSTARALDIDPQNAFCLTIDGVVNSNLATKHNIAEKRFEDALKLNPNEAMSWLVSGVLRSYRGEGQEAIKRIETANRLSPLDPLGYFFDALSAAVHLAAKNYEKSLTLCERSLARNDRHMSTMRIKICALHALDRRAEARVAASELMRRQPDFSVDDYERTHPAAGFETGRDVARALRASGLK